MIPVQDIKVRRADALDEPELMDMCRELHRENGLFEMSVPKVQHYLDMAFQRKGAVIGVIGDRNRLEGSIYLSISDYWYSDEWHLAELWSYVRPQYRRSNNAKALIAFAKRCADEMKIPVIIGIVSNDRTQPKIALYQRQLGTAAGAFFLYNGRTGTYAIATTAAPALLAVLPAQRAAG